MMQKQTLEFNVGYIFHKIEKDFFESSKYGKELCEFYGLVQVPKIWFGLKCSKWDGVNLSLKDQVELQAKLTRVVNDEFPNWDFRMHIRPVDEYIEIDYVFFKKAQPKKMTVSEIEKALGCKIEIISGD